MENLDIQQSPDSPDFETQHGDPWILEHFSFPYINHEIISWYDPRLQLEDPEAIRLREEERFALNY